MGTAVRLPDGWAQLVLIRAAALGGISSVFGDYRLRVDRRRSRGARALGGLSGGGRHRLSAAAANIGGVQIAAVLAGLSTVAKFGALSLLVVAAFLLGGDHGASWQHFASTGATVETGLFGLALISVLWAYDGFADLTFASGEVKDPQKQPAAGDLLFGIAAIIAHLSVGQHRVPVRAADRRHPVVAPRGRRYDVDDVRAGGRRVHLGHRDDLDVRIADGQHAGVAAIFFAMADDRLFFRADRDVHPRRHTPYVAILLAAGLGVAMVMTQTFEQLTDTFVLAMWPFYALSVGAIYRLRRMRPDMARPYRVVGYPLVPAVFIAAAVRSSSTPSGPIRSGRRLCSAWFSRACRSTTWRSARQDRRRRGIDRSREPRRSRTIGRVPMLTRIPAA